MGKEKVEESLHILRSPGPGHFLLAWCWLPEAWQERLGLAELYLKAGPETQEEMRFSFRSL